MRSDSGSCAACAPASFVDLSCDGIGFVLLDPIVQSLTLSRERKGQSLDGGGTSVIGGSVVDQSRPGPVMKLVSEWSMVIPPRRVNCSFSGAQLVWTDRGGLDS